MAYYFNAVGQTQEEAQKKAESYVKTLDRYTQPTLYTPHQRQDGTWVCTVQYYGLD